MNSKWLKSQELPLLGICCRLGRASVKEWLQFGRGYFCFKCEWRRGGGVLLAVVVGTPRPALRGAVVAVVRLLLNIPGSEERFRSAGI